MLINLKALGRPACLFDLDQPAAEPFVQEHENPLGDTGGLCQRFMPGTVLVPVSVPVSITEVTEVCLFMSIKGSLNTSHTRCLGITDQP